MLSFPTYLQGQQLPVLTIGDSTPLLRVREWIKGTPVEKFEKGKVYVVEFWATWCRPCIAAMPHLSALAEKFRNKITILGIDIYENKTPSLAKVKAFVESTGHRMDYHVAASDSNFMEVDWLVGTGEKDNGISRSFVVNAQGRLAWIGYPKDLEEVLPGIVTILGI